MIRSKVQEESKDDLFGFFAEESIEIDQFTFDEILTKRRRQIQCKKISQSLIEQAFAEDRNINGGYTKYLPVLIPIHSEENGYLESTERLNEMIISLMKSIELMKQVRKNTFTHDFYSLFYLCVPPSPSPLDTPER